MSVQKRAFKQAHKPGLMESKHHCLNTISNLQVAPVTLDAQATLVLLEAPASLAQLVNCSVHLHFLNICCPHSPTHCFNLSFLLKNIT